MSENGDRCVPLLPGSFSCQGQHQTLASKFDDPASVLELLSVVIEQVPAKGMEARFFAMGQGEIHQVQAQTGRAVRRHSSH